MTGTRRGQAATEKPRTAHATVALYPGARGSPCDCSGHPCPRAASAGKHDQHGGLRAGTRAGLRPGPRPRMHFYDGTDTTDLIYIHCCGRPHLPAGKSNPPGPDPRRVPRKTGGTRPWVAGSVHLPSGSFRARAAGPHDELLHRSDLRDPLEVAADRRRGKPPRLMGMPREQAHTRSLIGMPPAVCALAGGR
jgi:hypothetical protein